LNLQEAVITIFSTIANVDECNALSKEKETAGRTGL
jgi:hypothetical protein